MFDPRHSASGYALAWPPGLVRAELAAVLAGEQPLRVRDELEWLLVEAFVGSGPVADLDAACRDDPWDGTATGATGFGQELLERLDRPDGLGRQGPARAGPRQPVPSLFGLEPAVARLRTQHAWARLMVGLDAGGYFDHATGGRCQDRAGGASEHDEAMSHLIFEATEIDLGWPPPVATAPSQVLSGGRFFSLVEATGELAARPRYRWWHQGWGHYDYGDFGRGAGQAVYRWRVNQLFAAHAPGVHLTGQGHLVTTPPDWPAPPEGPTRLPLHSSPRAADA